MGPTWDGRIKPDIMAPGGSDQFKVDDHNPFVVWIDYVKLYRQGESIPYINTKHLELNIGETYPANTCDKQNDTMYCHVDYHPTSSRPPALELYIAWTLAGKTVIHRSDSIEVRYKIATRNNRDSSLYGAVYFQICKLDVESTCEKSFVEIDPLFIPWYASDEFKTIGRKVANLNLKDSDKYKDSIEAFSLRLDFDFSKGITTPDVCRGDSDTTCSYIFTSAAGTSMAAPFVSGLAALMYQKFQKMTGDSLHKHSMRNSTTKGLILQQDGDMSMARPHWN